MNGNQQRWFGYASQWLGIAMLCKAFDASLLAAVAFAFALGFGVACWRAGR